MLLSVGESESRSEMFYETAGRVSLVVSSTFASRKYQDGLGVAKGSGNVFVTIIAVSRHILTVG